MNLLLANGHPDAWHYPLGMVADEAALTIERINTATVGQAIAFRVAYISAKIEHGDQVMAEFVRKMSSGEP